MKYGRFIGEGKTAAVYEWEEGTVVKLFHSGYPEMSAAREFQNAKAIQHMNFAKPMAYEMARCGERTGIIYERIEGDGHGWY